MHNNKNMSTIQASRFLYSSSYKKLHAQRKKSSTTAAISVPRLSKSNAISLPPLPDRRLFDDEIALNNLFTDQNRPNSPNRKFSIKRETNNSLNDPLVTMKLHAIMEAVSDRVEMHKSVAEQRNNWNSLLLGSINAITLAAATMAGMAGMAGATTLKGEVLPALKIGSTAMYLAATGMLVVMNMIQPSQLAEEQRNAARLFKNLLVGIRSSLFVGRATSNNDVNEIMKKVLALDKAYPLPLLGVMLEKFPHRVEPAAWWPKKQRRNATKNQGSSDQNGWNSKLETEMRGIIRVIREKDKAEYIRLAEKALKLNKLLAVCGPILTGLAAIGSAFVGSPSGGSWALMVGVVCGALASVVNTIEHGAQVGMVFEMYRGNSGFFRLIEESIEANLEENDLERRENGELLEMKLALQLGRSLSELRDLVSSCKNGEIDEFASKLF